MAVAAILCMAGLRAPLVSAQDGGITVTPATLTLRLSKGVGQQSAQISIANHYTASVHLAFSFEPRLNAPTTAAPSEVLRVSQTEATLPAGASLQQTITLSSSDKLAPGSHLADLIITHVSAPGGGTVGILPSMRIPLVLVQEEGAISGLALTALGSPRFRMDTPNSVHLNLRNTGNIVALPRGVVKVSGPTGSVIRQGVLNTASQAVAPGATLSLATPLTQLEQSWWPGVYRTSVSYGLGGGQPTQTTSTWFVYVAWWHGAVVGGLVAVTLTGKRHLPRLIQGHRRPIASVAIPPPRPKKAMLVGRDII